MAKPKKRAILIAGPTASGKSALALALARQIGGVVVNADALQVYANWQVLTARPSDKELACAPHALYGHVDKLARYSVGQWVNEVSDLIVNTQQFPIIVGGTGLYFSILFSGLSAIPPVPADIRAKGNAMRSAKGGAGFLAQLQHQDPETLNQIDQNNPARLQRAWEVLESTGKGMSYWHARPGKPVFLPEETVSILLNWQVNTLNTRIDQRFDIMLKTGAIEECKAAQAEGFDASLPANRALGAREIIAALDGKTTMQDAVITAKTLTHQFAKRQRTWFRSKMKSWQQINMPLARDTEALTREIAKSIS